MEPHESHATELNLFDEATECGYTQFETATINYLHAPVTTFMFGCSASQIYSSPRSEMTKAHVSLETTIEPYGLVYIPPSTSDPRKSNRLTTVASE